MDHVDEKVLMPIEEWEDFKNKCLSQYQLSDVEVLRFRLVFLGALAASTDFFESLLSGQFEQDEAQKYYVRWKENLQEEMNRFDLDFVVRFLGGPRGGNN
jgi:hypothetical protein